MGRSNEAEEGSNAAEGRNAAPTEAAAETKAAAGDRTDGDTAAAEAHAAEQFMWGFGWGSFADLVGAEATAAAEAKVAAEARSAAEAKAAAKLGAAAGASSSDESGDEYFRPRLSLP